MGFFGSQIRGEYISDYIKVVIPLAVDMLVLITNEITKYRDYNWNKKDLPQVCRYITVV